MKLNKFLCLAFALILLISSCSGCGKSSNTLVTKKFDSKSEAKSISTQEIASNDNYSLEWNDENKCLLLTELASGKIWSNIPYEYLLSSGSSANVNSTLNITVADAVTLQLTTSRGYSDAVRDGRVFCKKIKNGVRITYCFDKYKISVPVEYVLRDDSLCVTIDTPEITEDSTYLLLSISLAPFICSTRNEVAGSYLFIPTGSGALMYAKETPEIERTYSGEVYGLDETRPITVSASNDQAIRMPIFGAKNGDNAILGIIEKGSGSAFIEAMSGNANTGYSNVYPTFYVRGYDVIDKSSYKGITDDLTRVSKYLSKEIISVGYYTLSGENANYNGMAKRYREYLQDNGYLKSKVSSSSSSYSVTVLGGVLTTSLVMGMPRKTLKSMTSFSEANEIIDELTKENQTSPVIRMQGYGDSGINYGKVAGGYEFASKLGSNKDRKKLEKTCKKNNISLFYDFDLIHYTKSGSGFSYLSNCAKTAILKKAEQNLISIPLRSFNEEMSYRILSRNSLGKAVDKLINMAQKKKIDGVSVTSLGSVAYSDYSEYSYISKGKIDEDVTKMLKSMKSKKISVATGANSYAASVASVVFDAPTDNGYYNAFDEEIPFYSLVFHGYIPTYSEAINIASDKRSAIMKAAIGGTGLGFSVIDNFDTSFSETGMEKLYGMVYEDNKDFIKTEVKKYGEFYKSVSNSPIDSYEMVDKNLSKTTFSNGVILYANHSNETINTPLGKVEAFGYLWN